MRIILSAPTIHPITWTLTKIQNLNPVGIQDLTLYQTQFNSHRDYIERDSTNRIIGMWADYYDYEPTSDTDTNTDTDTEVSEITAEIEATSAYINVGGSYKNLTAKVYDMEKSEITESYSDAKFTWTCSIDDTDWTDKVTWYRSDYNQIKIKFPNDRTQLGKQLLVKCAIILNDKTIETTTLFGLKV